ncbi:MAG: sigma 54-interacting transcriptional regulator [Pseudomonadota bacterium]
MKPVSVDVMVAQHSPETAGAAVVRLNAADQKIVASNGALGSLLGLDASELSGIHWQRALGVVAQPEQALSRVITAGVRSVIPPTLLRPSSTAEMVVGGYLYPEQEAGQKQLVLLLFRLGVDRDQLFSRPVGNSDVLAVLGLENSGDEQWHAADMARRMVDIHFGLQQIVPAKEDVGMPRGSTIPIALRDVLLEDSHDISAALLSHLTPLLRGQAKIRIGLAQGDEKASPMLALIAANNALLRMQRTATDDLVATSSPDDVLFLGTTAISTDGIFSEDGTPGSQDYLSALSEIDYDPQHSVEYLDYMVEITLRQKGVIAAAVYRRRFDDSHEYVTGGVSGIDAAATHLRNDKQLPRALRQAAQKVTLDKLQALDHIPVGRSKCMIFALRLYERVLGFVVLQYAPESTPAEDGFTLGVTALHHLSTELSLAAEWRQTSEAIAQPGSVVPLKPIEQRIDGYVGDNMEGAIDQAVFLAQLDVPVAIIGPRGTGKLYVAKVIHQESGASPDKLIAIDCREFRGKKDALSRISRELERSKGKTLVFKSPHLMNAEVQMKLARQVSTRVLADSNPPRYVPASGLIGLFPDSLEDLVRRGELQEKLASAFGAFPIRVPPIKDRKRAVLRWAYKILSQEGERRDRKLTGFTPDAEQAMLGHEWPGNISEMRQCIVTALDRTDKEWLTPVDLGLFKGLSPAGAGRSEKRAYLQVAVEPPAEDSQYAPTTQEELSVALGEALHRLRELDAVLPLGAWLDDEVVLAVYDRYRENMRAAADFLHTKPRNLSRWLPKIRARERERDDSSLWQSPQKLIRRWLKEAPSLEVPPQRQMQDILLSHVVSQCADLGVADRARIMGVSTPTYQKRVQELSQ